MLILNSYFSFLIFILNLWFPKKFTFYLEISRFTFTISGTLYIILNKIFLDNYLKHANDAERTITSALRLGYRHIDTVSAYSNEKYIGSILKQLGIGGVGGNPPGPGGSLSLRREDLFITSKFFRFLI